MANLPCYDEMLKVYRAGGDKWVETDWDTVEYQLECLPPARMTANAFAVGEPFTGCELGPVHAVFCTVDDRYWGKLVPLVTFDPEKFTSEIREQIRESSDV